MWRSSKIRSPFPVIWASPITDAIWGNSLVRGTTFPHFGHEYRAPLIPKKSPIENVMSLLLYFLGISLACLIRRCACAQRTWTLPRAWRQEQGTSSSRYQANPSTRNETHCHQQHLCVVLGRIFVFRVAAAWLRRRIQVHACNSANGFFTSHQHSCKWRSNAFVLQMFNTCVASLYCHRSDS